MVAIEFTPQIIKKLDELRGNLTRNEYARNIMLQALGFIQERAKQEMGNNEIQS